MLRRFHPAVLFIVWLLFAMSGQGLAAERFALVIGNSAYATAPLPNPANDADLMARTLEGLGFKVRLHKDLTRRDMRRAIVDFGQGLEQAPKGSVALIYYAGHGIRIEGENYLIPVDAEISDPLDVKIEGVQASTVLETLNRYEGLNIVVLDACRNNPFEGGTRSGGGGLARMEAPTGTLVAFSTAPGRVAEDGVGRNSPYTSALARSMQIPGLKVEDVFKRVRIEVLDRTDKRQVPWESSSLIGDFYFSGGAGASPPPAVASAEAQQPAVQAVPAPATVPPPAAPRDLLSGDVAAAAMDPTPAPPGIPSDLPQHVAVPPLKPLPVDGVWRLNFTGTRFRISQGRAYAIDGYNNAVIFTIAPGQVTGREIVQTGQGTYQGKDIVIGGTLALTLRADRKLDIGVVGGLVPFSSTFVPIAVDDPVAFDDELKIVQARQ